MILEGCSNVKPCPKRCTRNCLRILTPRDDLGAKGSFRYLPREAQRAQKKKKSLQNTNLYYNALKDDDACKAVLLPKTSVFYLAINTRMF